MIGHQKQLLFLKNCLEQGRMPHSFLFSGPASLGKKLAALEMAAWLKCSFPDLIMVEPKEGETKISQIRDLIWKLSLKPYSAPLKVAIVDKAETMNQEAQNCFLKTLEEPKDKTLLILIADQQGPLLQTIISR